MHTLILQNRGREGSNGKSFTIQVLGDSPAKDAVMDSVRALEHHPAKAERRSLIDMLSIIEKHNFRICHAERGENEEGLEEWLFILQG